MKRNDSKRVPDPVFQTDVEALDYIEEGVESMLKVVDARRMRPRLALALSQVLDELMVTRG